jgi:glutamine---fructose-6-phosphate transaminase (isomerizing)
MCGIFGLIRGDSTSPQTDERAIHTVLALGLKAEERGLDAAGLAAFCPSPRELPWTSPDATLAGSALAHIDNTLIVKGPGRFSALPLADHAQDLARLGVFLGHTRWATQGPVADLANASPLLAGALVGTHNGDIDIESVPHHKTMSSVAHGQTDTERLYLALHAAHGDRSAMTKVMRSIRGRAALAFFDRSRPDRIYLARTAMSPLAYAWTADGDFVYASNPDWFRQIERETRGQLSFRDITLVPEGHLLTVSTLTADVTDVRRFTPTCRERDLMLVSTAVYRKFTPEDRAAYQLLNRHKVRLAPLRGWPELSPAPVITPVVESSEVEFPDNEWADVGAAFALDELENLCWAMGDFDHRAYESVFEVSEEEAEEIVEALRSEVMAAYAAGRTVPGWSPYTDEVAA